MQHFKVSLAGAVRAALAVAMTVSCTATPGSDDRRMSRRIQTATAVDLDLVPTGAVAGTVKALPATDLAGLVVFVPGSGFMAAVAADGTFEIGGVPAGTVSLMVVAPGYVPARLASVPVPAGSVSRGNDLLLVLAPPTPAPAPSGPPRVPASHRYYAQAYDTCTACHGDLTDKVFQPFPADHAGRTTGSCLLCHSKAADQDPPVLGMTVARIDPAAAPALDGAGTDAAWLQTAKVQIPLRGGINASETTVDLKAVHDGTEVYFLATWRDPTESLERGPFVKQADGTWKKTPYYPSHYEDKFGLIWHTGTGMDGFKTRGCAVTCHATTPYRDRPLKYVDPGTKLDMWHAKMVRTVMPPDVQQIDDQNVIWTDLLDDATGSGKAWDDMIKDGGRRGDPRTGGGYLDNPKSAGGAPEWMPAFAPFKVTDGRSFWLAGATASFDDGLFSAGDKVAAIHVAKLLGDRGDIAARARWANGVWTMEFRRALVPSNTDGRDVLFEAGKTYYMGAANFDNAQIGHSVQFGVTEVRFAP